MPSGGGAAIQSPGSEVMDTVPSCQWKFRAKCEFIDPRGLCVRQMPTCEERVGRYRPWELELAVPFGPIGEKGMFTRIIVTNACKDPENREFDRPRLMLRDVQ